jgi:hypothetical protein
MGWSWALYFANEAVNHMVAKAAGIGPSWLMRDKGPLPELLPDHDLGGVYVDNISLIGANARRVDALSRAVHDQSVVDQLPLVWSFEAPVQLMESVGVVLDLEHLVCRNKPRRTWRFDMATRGFLRRSSVRGEHLMVWVGHAISLLMLARPAFSILDAVYRFINQAWGRRQWLPNQVRQEMRSVVGAVWLAEINMAAGFIPEVVVSDSWIR